MKLPIFILAICFSFSLCADTIQLTPLHQEDPHFIHYRCLMMEGSVSRLQELTDSLDPEMKDKFQVEIDNLKLNLGYPVSYGIVPK